ncbi:ATP-binding protein, partial [Vibrio vulnificus]|nr:ATP-binding protein [Vibrio vulnificus]
NGGRHSVDVLSSGERHILTFLSLVVIAGRERDILIIDEPEISLNIKWQRTLMSLIQDLVPYTQIIVASHSSLIAKKIPQSLVKLSPEVM